MEKEAKWLKQPSAPPPMALPLPLLVVALLLPEKIIKMGLETIRFANLPFQTSSS